MTAGPVIRPTRATVYGGLLGGAATSAGIALTATSGWLIVRASERPVILTLLAAIVAVRAFGMARPFFRYLERLVSHDAALADLAERRSSVYSALVPLTPARLGRRSRVGTPEHDRERELPLRELGPERLAYFDERYYFFAADPDLSLKAWHAGLRVVPAYGCMIDHEQRADERRAADNPHGETDNASLFAKWDLPEKNLTCNDFNADRPCTLRGLRTAAAA